MNVSAWFGITFIFRSWHRHGELNTFRNLLDHDAAGGTVARGELDVCVVGRVYAALLTLYRVVPTLTSSPTAHNSRVRAGRRHMH